MDRYLFTSNPLPFQKTYIFCGFFFGVFSLNYLVKVSVLVRPLREQHQDKRKYFVCAKSFESFFGFYRNYFV